ncbi:MAG: hypothetical protein BGO67_01860 [Alphaproteobacteria bacterium 41-28]|nr:MAG: hypothetical protein BGO67_01860 [Alphaproteobacteria bacterium 41-28]
MKKDICKFKKRLFLSGVALILSTLSASSMEEKGESSEKDLVIVAKRSWKHFEQFGTPPDEENTDPKETQFKHYFDGLFEKGKDQKITNWLFQFLKEKSLATGYRYGTGYQYKFQWGGRHFRIENPHHELDSSNLAPPRAYMTFKWDEKHNNWETLATFRSSTENQDLSDKELWKTIDPFKQRSMSNRLYIREIE